MRTTTALLTACAIAGLAGHVTAAVKVKTQFTKSFDFTKAKTWSWHEGGPGEVKMALTADDNPELVRQRAEPVIMEAVGATLPQRGLAAAASGAPSDVKINTTCSSRSEPTRRLSDSFFPRSRRGACLRSPARRSRISVIERGSLVLDISANKEVVWRGIGQAELKPGQTPEKLPRSSAQRSLTSSEIST